MTNEIELDNTWPDGATICVVSDAPEPDDIRRSVCPRCQGVQVGSSECRSCHQSFTQPAPGRWHGSSGRLFLKAMQIAQLDPAGVATANISRRTFPNWWKGDAFGKEFLEEHLEPIYTSTGKLSKRVSRSMLWSERMESNIDNLLADLQLHDPNLIVAQGNEVMDVIVGRRGVANYRGSIVSSRGGFERSDETPFKVLCIEHPKFIVRGNLTDFWILGHDLKKAKRESEFREIRRYPVIVQSDCEHSLSFILASLRLVRDNPSKLWTLDVETRAGTLACYSIAIRLDSGSLFTFCVPLQLTTGPYWTAEEECQIWEALDEAARANPNLCNQNVEYDLYYLLRHGVEAAGIYMDTMLAHALLYPEFPKGLDFLCSFYLDDVEYYKGEGRDWGAGDRDPQLWAYCCQDSAQTLRVVERIDEELRKRGWYERYHGRTK